MKQITNVLVLFLACGSIAGMDYSSQSKVIPGGCSVAINGVNITKNLQELAEENRKYKEALYLANWSIQQYQEEQQIKEELIEKLQSQLQAGPVSSNPNQQPIDPKTTPNDPNSETSSLFKRLEKIHLAAAVPAALLAIVNRIGVTKTMNYGARIAFTGSLLSGLSLGLGAILSGIGITGLHFGNQLLGQACMGFAVIVLQSIGGGGFNLQCICSLLREIR